MKFSDYLKKTFPRNINSQEQNIRLAIGAIFIALSFSGYVDSSQEFWLVVLGWLGLMSGVIGHCPIYGLFGKSTYGPKK